MFRVFRVSLATATVPCAAVQGQHATHHALRLVARRGLAGLQLQPRLDDICNQYACSRIKSPRDRGALAARFGPAPMGLVKVVAVATLAPLVRHSLSSWDRSLLPAMASDGCAQRRAAAAGDCGCGDQASAAAARGALPNEGAICVLAALARLAQR